MAARSPSGATFWLLLISRLLALYLRFVYATSRWRVESPAILESVRAAGLPAIMVFWHGRLAAMPYVFQRFEKGHVLISAHRDGELIARVIEAMNFATVRGSTARQKPGDARPVDKGGAAALRSMIRILKGGGCIGITPDGPRGPRMRVSPGTVLLAALSGARLIPVSYSAGLAVRFNSWDRFILPLPFGRIWIAIGEPLSVPREADARALSHAQRQLEERLNGLTAQCDRNAGQEPIAPAPETAPAEAARLLEPLP
jgi:lysophospholipid acyltransferase (LPLAT)-like uncharacterized protein